MRAFALLEHVPFAIFSVAGVTAAGILVGYPASLWISEKVANYLSVFPTTKFNRVLPLINRAEDHLNERDCRGHRSL